jgi:hypothetical protein
MGHTCAFSCARWAKCTGIQRNALLENAICPPATAECACAALRNKDGGWPVVKMMNLLQMDFINPLIFQPVYFTKPQCCTPKYK